MYIFDLDGTLVDTRDAVREAYKRVGVTMPDSAWGKPSSAWLPIPWLVKQKNVHYLKCLEMHADKLPLFDYAQREKCPIITGASRQAVAHVQTIYGQLNIELCGASRERKVEYLQNIRPHPKERLTYVDDDSHTRNLVRKKVPQCISLSPSEAYQQLSQRQELIRD